MLLGALRKHSKSFLIYLMFAMIIVVFVFTFNTGAGRGGGCTPPEVPLYAKVGANGLTQDTFVMGMNLLPSFFQSPAGMSFALAAGLDTAALLRREMEDLTPAQANAILQAVEMIYLASDEAIRMGFKINDKDLAKAMYPESFYKEEEPKEGEVELGEPRKVFDRQAFQSWVVYGLHSSEQEYEEFVRRVLLAFKLQAFLSGVVLVEPTEAEIMAKARETKVDLSYVEFRPELFEDRVAVKDADVAAFVAGNDAKVREYYDSHPAKFHTAEAWKIAVIFADAKKEAPKRGEPAAEPVPPTKEELAAAQAKAQDLLDRFSGRKPLLNEPAAAPQPQPAAEGAAPPPAAAQPEETKDPLERFKELAKRESDHKETAERSGLMPDWQTSADLEAGAPGKAVADALAGAKAGTVVGPVRTPEGSWLVFVQESRPKKDLDLEAAKPEVAAALLKEEKAPEMARAEAEKYLAAATKQEKQDLEVALEEYKKGLAAREGEDFSLLKVSKTGKFSLATPEFSIPGIGRFEELFKAAFKMTDKAPLASAAYVHPETKRAYAVKLLERVAAPVQVEQEKLDQEKESLGFTRDLPYFESWLRALRQSAVERGDMERTEEFSSYLAYLQNQIDEQEKRRAREAAKEGAGAEAAPPAE